VAVIGDADELAAAGFDFDADTRSSGVERVLEQFLDHGRGTIDDLAGRDLIGHLVGENTDAPHKGQGYRSALESTANACGIQAAETSVNDSAKQLKDCAEIGRNS
jgi:hypothetical protein